MTFVDPLFAFIDDAISRGESVLVILFCKIYDIICIYYYYLTIVLKVHCLAGAHRAGTTGCACLVHYAKLDVPNAITVAKKCRPIIDPIGQLPEFLNRLKKAEDSVGKEN